MCTLNLLDGTGKKLRGNSHDRCHRFRLLGICRRYVEGSGVSAVIEWSKIPQFPEASVVPGTRLCSGGTHPKMGQLWRKIQLGEWQQRLILFDPKPAVDYGSRGTKKADPAVEAMLLSRDYTRFHRNPDSQTKTTSGTLTRIVTESDPGPSRHAVPSTDGPAWPQHIIPGSRVPECPHTEVHVSVVYYIGNGESRYPEEYNRQGASSPNLFASSASDTTFRYGTIILSRTCLGLEFL
jgi:hypothetical protein